MAIALAASYNVNSTASNASTLTTASFTPAVGEVIVVKFASEDGANDITFANLPTSSAGSLTFTRRASVITTGFCQVELYTAVVGAGQNVAMTISSPALVFSNWHSMTVERYTGAQLAATPVVINTTGTGAPSTTLSTTAANSVVSWGSGDWNATSPTGATYRSSATQTGLHNRSPNNYVAYYAYQSAASAGSQTLGLSAPTGQKWSIAAIEIQASAAGGTNGTVTSTAASFTASVLAPVVRAGVSVAAALASAALSALAPGVSAAGTGAVTAVAAAASITAPTPGMSAAAALATPSAAATAAAVSPSVSGGSAGASYRVFSVDGPSSGNADSPVNLGMEFYVTSAANLTTLWFWNPATNSNTDTRTAAVWEVAAGNTAGANITGTVTFTSNAAGQWNSAVLATPVALTPNQRYRIGVHHPSAGYPATASGWPADVVNGPLTAPSTANATSNDQGSYGYFSTLAFPNEPSTGNYWVDVSVSTGSGGSNGSVAAVVATASAGTPVGLISGAAGLSAVSTSAVVAAVAPMPSAAGLVGAPAAQVSTTAGVPMISAGGTGSVLANAAASSTTAWAPGYASGATIGAASAAMSASGYAPTVLVGTNATVAPPPTSSIATALAPTGVGETKTEGGGAASATMSALPPVVTGSTLTVVVVPVASITATAQSPGVAATGGVTVAAAAASATARAWAPTNHQVELRNITIVAVAPPSSSWSVIEPVGHSLIGTDTSTEQFDLAVPSSAIDTPEPGTNWTHASPGVESFDFSDLKLNLIAAIPVLEP